MTDNTTAADSGFEYPDGSTPPVGEDGQPILADRTADFPDEAGEATNIVGEPVFSRQTGEGSGLTAPLTLMAKRAARIARVHEFQAEAVDGAETPDLDDAGTTTPDEDESGEGGAQVGAEDGLGDETPADSDPGEVDDLGFEPADHTVAEVQKYLDENPEQSTYVLDRERTGKARTTLIGA